jgi:hypothetical protein
VIEAAKDKLRDLAAARLSLYVREMGEEFFGKLVANKANWRAGYLPAHDCYAVFPQTAQGGVIVGPFTVVKWKHLELWLQDVTGTELAALKDEARQVGFEQWAAA